MPVQPHKNNIIPTNLRKPRFCSFCLLFLSLFTSQLTPLSLACKAKEQCSGFIPMMHGGKQTCKDIQWSLRQCSGLNKSTLTALIADKRIYTQETSEYLLWSPLTPPTTSSHQTLPHLDLLPTPPFYTLHPSPPPTWVQWVVCCQVYMVGCLRQVQTISVFVNVSVWFSNLCLWSGF